MDPITLIVTALSARAGTAHQNAALTALPDAQAELMTLARHRLRARPNGGMVLRQHAEDPKRWARPLAKALAAERAGGDAELIAAAQAVLRLTDEAGSSRGKYTLDAPSPSGPAPG